MAKDFRAWCIDQQINYTQLCEDMAKELGAQRVKMRMGKGTSTITPPITTITFISEELAGNLEENNGPSEAAEAV